MDKWLQMLFNSLASNPRRPHDELEMPEDALLHVWKTTVTKTELTDSSG